MGEVMGRRPGGCDVCCDGGRRDGAAGTVVGREVLSSSVTSRRAPTREGGLRSGGADFSGAWGGAGLCRSERKARSWVGEAGRSWPMIMKAWLGLGLALA
jgi:hypothetical protein